jgi:hypothetical protein
LITNISKRPTTENKWSEKNNFEITEEMWKIIYTNSKHVTNDTTILNFQYKITHRLLACNYNLKTWKIKQTNTCNYCDKIDTIEHHLIECETTETFWRQVFNWWANSLKVWLQVDTYEVLFGIPNENNEPITV